ncbi:MAG: Fe-S cluster assembly protein SufD [Lentisphaerae bacterium GWF2_57_35]|nr:MAG: Fe-S cluster assembly protein SufD [Lentisphaerae bacterium GWF2_57_35]
MEIREEELVAGFDEELLARLNDGPEWLCEARRAAFRRYAAIPLPTARDEEWRRTDPARFPFKDMTPMDRYDAAGALTAGEWNAWFDVVATVEGDRYAIQDVSGVLARKSLRVMTLAEAAEQYPERLSPYLQGQARGVPPGKYEALNEAFWTVGFFIDVPADTQLEKGILIRYINPPDGRIFMPRTIAVVGARSRVSMMEHFASADTARFLSVTAREVYLDESSVMNLTSLQEWGKSVYHLSSDWGFVARAAKLNWVAMHFGGRVSKMLLGCDTAGEGAEAELDGMYIGTQKQHYDQKTLQVHSAPKTYSNLLYKGAVKDKAYSVYQGMIIARPGANGVDAYQKNNNLVLDDGARADSLPGLQIDTDDLKCSHGSTIGNLNEEEVFYLRSRGLNNDEARKILLKGFFEEIVQKIPVEPVREKVRERIEEKMGSGGQ